MNMHFRHNIKSLFKVNHLFVKIQKLSFQNSVSSFRHLKRLSTDYLILLFLLYVSVYSKIELQSLIFLNNNENFLKLNMQRQELIPNTFLENSLLETDRHHTNIHTSFKHPKVEKIRPFNSHITSTNYNNSNPKQQLINAFKFVSSSKKIECNPQFINLLTNQYAMMNPLIVSIWGPHKSGKSFLIDNLLSNSQGTLIRSFSKSSNQGVNCSMRKLTTTQGNPIIFLDWAGFDRTEKEIQYDAFLLAYLISDVILLNYNCFELGYENHFLQIIQKVKEKITSNEVEYSLPQLIISRRDVNSNNNYTTNFLQSINNLQLFQLNPTVAYFIFPGTQSIKEEEIVDAPVVTLEKNFGNTCLQLMDVIYAANIRQINNNPIIGSILAVLVGSFTSMINRFHKVDVDSCWSDVLEALSVNAYNNFITKYSQELQKQFKTQTPLNKYELFLKLRKVKSSAHNKYSTRQYSLLNFTSLKEQPIFEKYKNKMKDFAFAKEELINSINQSKSANVNNKIIDQCKKKYLGMDQSFHKEKINDYLNSFASLPFQHNKSFSINTNVKQLLNNQLRRIKSKSDAPQLKNLQKQLQQKDGEMADVIKKQKDRISSFSKNLQNMKDSKSKYQLNLIAKQQKLGSLISLNKSKQEQRKSKMTQQEKQNEQKLNRIRAQNNRKLQDQFQMIKDLRLEFKDAAKKNSIHQAQTNSKLKQKDEYINGMKKKVKQLQKNRDQKKNQIERLKGVLLNAGKKKGMCGCFG